MKARNIAKALGCSLAMALASPAWAGDSWSEASMKPLRAASLDAGSAHVVSYFTPISGVCRLTIMIVQKEDEPKTAAPTRVELLVEPGRAAYVDDADGKSSRFTCLFGAEAMNVVRTERVALAPAR